MFSRLLKFLFVLSPLCLLGSDLEEYRLDEGEPNVRVSGEFVYFTRCVGLRPRRGSYSPGFRVGVERDGIFKGIDLGGAYTFWKGEGEKTFTIPILGRTRRISREDRMDGFELFMGHRFGIFKPCVGVEWGGMDSWMNINERWEVLNRNRYLGPLVGLEVEKRFLKYFSVGGRISFSYLDTNYRRVINRVVNVEDRFMLPRSKMDLSAEFVLPMKKSCFRVKGGYEMQYFWFKGVYEQIDWGSPLNLQGFTGEVSFDY